MYSSFLSIRQFCVFVILMYSTYLYIRYFLCIRGFCVFNISIMNFIEDQCDNSMFCMKLAKSFTETMRMMQTDYELKVLSKPRCHGQFKIFKGGWQSVEENNRSHKRKVIFLFYSQHAIDFLF